MKVTVVTGLPAKGDMEIDACHSDRSIRKISQRLLLLGLFFLPCFGWAQYTLHINPVDKDSAAISRQFGLITAFRSREQCQQYLSNLLPLLQGKGYVAASIDSVVYAEKEASIRLYVGDPWRWAKVDTRYADPTLLAAVAWTGRSFDSRPMDMRVFRYRQQLMLDYLENNGYPFAKVGLDSVTLRDSGDVSAVLRIDKGPLYKIDSIRIFGNARISHEFLQRYLNIPNGSIYRKERLQIISKKILELPYVQEQQPWSLTMLADGSVINLYLKPKKSSQIDALVGFLPSDNPALGNKVVVTGEATVNLQNTLGNGETMKLDWQQLQPGSPRLDLVYQQPFIFNSPFGLNTSFDLYKQDSTYININFIIGAQYTFSANQNGSVFLQLASSNLLFVDTPAVIASHTLPPEADISSISLGVTYTFNNTNYRFNPRRGNEFNFLGSAGTKTVHQNSTIVGLTDPSDSGFKFQSLYDTVRLHSFQFLVRVDAAHYFPIGRAATLKLGFNAGIYSSPNTYRNDLFLIGGYKLLRGFDEASILASEYAVGTLEYRYLTGLNSYLFTFVDAGWAMNNVADYNLNSVYVGTGVGMAFETKAGIFNMSLAAGRTSELPFDFHATKIHIGYVSFF
ncbi:MAG TPA: BamA/TamA family outer membrane protein [Puia sp.]|jgi:outer membrane protein assembly factor BamA|nr:BamA/TamA family outer membrane protein [Puia sp.]